MFPDFTATTTKGMITFSDWAAGNWVLLLSHPAAFTPVCTSEIAALAERMSEFTERHVKIMALTGDPLDRIQKWTAEIEAMHDIRIDFPHVADEQRVISRGCGLVSQEACSERTFCARRTFLIDPTGKIRMILDYPLAVGRSVDETLRAIDALIISDRLGTSAPSDWQIGDPLLLSHTESLRSLERRFGENVGGDKPYFRCLDFSSHLTRKKTTKASSLPAISTAEVDRLSKRQTSILMTRLVDFS